MLTTKKIATIDLQKCDSRKNCKSLALCPTKAIIRDEDGFLYVDTTCTGCGKCIKACVRRAIHLT